MTGAVLTSVAAEIPPPTALGWQEAQLGARASSPTSSPARMVGGTVLAADIGVIALTSMLAHVLRHGSAVITFEVVLGTLFAAGLSVNVLQATGCYRQLVSTPLPVQVMKALRGWCVSFCLLLILAYLTKTSEQFSRVWVVTWFAGATLGLVVVRGWTTARLRRWRQDGKLARTVAVVDVDGAGVALARRLLRSSGGEMHLVGVFAAEGAGQAGIDGLLGLARLFRIDEVVVSVGGAAGRPERNGTERDGTERDGTGGGGAPDLDAVMLKLATIPTNVRLSPPVPQLSVVPRDASLLFGQLVLTVYTRPLGDWARVVKRIEDLVISSVAITFAAPLLLLVAIAIKLESPGPVLFRQPRLGFNNNVITVYKFRSMRHRTVQETDVPQARRHDPRVTRIGGFLRRTSIDELPQLLNVLRGQMSLVGPRPHALAHNEHYAALIDGYLGRHRVQPGITGWAQVNGFRGETDTLEKMQRRVEHDLAYTDGWSLGLDLRILAMTVATTLFDRNAY